MVGIVLGVVSVISCRSRFISRTTLIYYNIIVMRSFLYNKELSLWQCSYYVVPLYSLKFSKCQFVFLFFKIRVMKVYIYTIEVPTHNLLNLIYFFNLWTEALISRISLLPLISCPVKNAAWPRSLSRSGAGGLEMLEGWVWVIARSEPGQARCGILLISLTGSCWLSCSCGNTQEKAVSGPALTWCQHHHQPHCQPHNTILITIY